MTAGSKAFCNAGKSSLWSANFRWIVLGKYDYSRSLASLSLVIPQFTIPS